MKTKQLLIVLILLVALLLAGCGTKETPPLAVPDGAKAGELIGLEDCEFQSVSSKTKYVAKCGTLVVPENWDKANSRLIALPVTRVPSSGSNHAEPVFVLLGGPGLSNFSWTPPDWLFENYDVVMIGYRGVDGTVTLSCPEVSRLMKAHSGKDLFSEQAHTEYVVAVKACASTHQEAGVDLSGYSAPNVVEDMEATRKALGYDRINLYSLSFGTRIAQIYAYMHPDSLHRLVLIGVSTPGSTVWKPAALDEIIEHISGLCTQDAVCNRRISDLAQTMYDVNHNMPKRWLFFNIDPDTVRLAAHFGFLENSMMPMVFDAYLAAAEGDPSGLAMANLLPSLFVGGQLVGDQINKGGSLDNDKYGGIESISLEGSIMGAPMAELIWPIASEWPIELTSQNLREFHETDVEMLLVNGTVDFSTPPTALDEAKPYFHKGQIVLLPEFSHVGDVQTLQPEAFERLLTSYYDTGVADDSLYTYQTLSFEPGMRLTVIAKLLVAAIIFLPALLILGIVLAVRRVRKPRSIKSDMAVKEYEVL